MSVSVCIYIYTHTHIKNRDYTVKKTLSQSSDDFFYHMKLLVTAIVL